MRGSWRPNKDCNILTPFFPVLLSCSTGGLGAQPLLGHGSHSSIFSPTNAPSYIIVLRPLNSNRRQSRLSPDILDRMHLLFTQVHFFFWQLGRVGGQYATHGQQSILTNQLALSMVFDLHRVSHISELALNITFAWLCKKGHPAKVEYLMDFSDISTHQLYNIKHSYLLLIIWTQFFKCSNLIPISYTQFSVIK